MIEITARKMVDGVQQEAVIASDLGDTLEDAIEKFGDEVVFSNFKQSAKITAQAAMRRYLESGLDNSAIAEKMSAWKPGVTLDRTIDPVSTLRNMLKGKTKKEKEQILADVGL